MAELRFYKNLFEDNYESKQYDKSKTLLEQIESFSDGNTYKDLLVECYDSETGETYYGSLDDSDKASVLITVDNHSVSADYEVQDKDIVRIVFIPSAYDHHFDPLVGGVAGALFGLAAVGILALIPGINVAASTVVLYAMLGATVGLAAGGAALAVSELSNYKIQGDKEGKTLPDVRGASNQLLEGNPFPFVIGKHLISPFIVGNPVTEYSGERGCDAYIRVVYCAGYGPLKLTDFKLSDFLLAYNRDQGVSRPTIINGILKGYSTNEADDGDILDRWKNNDIQIELLQHNPFADINHGTIYPDKVVDQQIEGQVMYVASGDLDEAVNVAYKGQSYPNTFRTNNVYFTEGCPKEFTVNIDFPNGLFKSRTERVANEQKTVYSDIPLWVCIQWRPYNKNNNSSDSEGSDYSEWNNITRFKISNSETVDYGAVFTPELAKTDMNAHIGNKITELNQDEKTVKQTVSPLDAIRDVKAYPSNYTSSIKYDSNKGIFWEKSGKTEYIYSGKLSNAPDRYIIGRVCNKSRSYNIGEAVYDSTTKTLYFDCNPNSNGTIHKNFADNIVYTYLDETKEMDFYYSVRANSISSSTSTQTIKVNIIATNGTFYKNSKQSRFYSGFWQGKTLCNFQSLSGDENKSISQMRISSTITLTDAQCKAMLQDDNDIHGVEIRAIRVSPNYMNQQKVETENVGAYAFSDVVKVSSIVTKVFDKEKLEKQNRVETVKVASDADLKKFAYIAIKAKADESGYIKSSLGSFNCMAESFSPYIDSDKTIKPENVSRITEYYGYYDPNKVNASDVSSKANRDTKKAFRINKTTNSIEVLLGTDNTAKAEYEDARKNGINWVKQRAGSDFTDKIKQAVFKVKCYSSDNVVFYSDPEHKHQIDKPSKFTVKNEGNGVYTYNGYYNRNGAVCNSLSDDAAMYNNNGVANGFLLAAFGAHNGMYAQGCEDVDLNSVIEWNDASQDVQDGSTYSKSTVFNGVTYQAGDKTHVRFEANGYVSQSQKLEDVLRKLTIAGRAVFTYDETGKIKVIMDKPVPYPVGVINQTNCISGTNTYSYEEPPAGLRIPFADQNDGFEQNAIYCWSDGNSLASYKGTVESYSFDFVTSPEQTWSLGRYVLACRVLNREILTRKIGPEGNTYSLGDVVLVQGDDLLIGGGSGRIQQVLENSSKIYGFISDTYFEYLGETDTEGCTQGVTVLQPKKFGNSRTVTLRLSTTKSVKVDGITYKMKKGLTNVVLFADAVSKGNDNEPNQQSSIAYNFKTGDVCMFGLITKISAKYRIIKIKPEGNGNFTETLISYNPDIYNYGAALPSFQNFITRPKVSVDGITISDTPNKISDLNNMLSAQGSVFDSLYSNHIITLYRQSDKVLTRGDLPETFMSYDFSTNKISWSDTSKINGWVEEKPETETADHIYVISATAFGKDRTDIIKADEWSTPVPFGLNGTDGYNVYTIQLFRRSEVAPETMPQGIIYSFEKSEISGGYLNGWSLSMPGVDNENNPMWEIHATASTTETTDAITDNEWSEPVKLLESAEVSKAEIIELIDERKMVSAPNVSIQPSYVGFQVNGKNVTPVSQMSSHVIHVFQTGEELDFTLGTIELPYGWSYTKDGNRVSLMVSSGTRIRNGNINIPVIFRAYKANHIYCTSKDEDTGYYYWNGFETSAGEKPPYGARSYADTDTTYDLTVSYTMVKSGRYLGSYSSISDIQLSNLGIDDYFTWTGTNTETILCKDGIFKQTCIYTWNGLNFEEDIDPEHLAGALSDVLSIASAELDKNNSQASVLLDHLTANSAFIKKLVVTEGAFMRALAVTDVVIGDKNDEGSIQSFGYDSITGKGWKIFGNGKAVFNQVTVKGSVYADSFKASDEARVDLEDAINLYSYALKGSRYTVHTIVSKMDKDGFNYTLYKSGVICTDSLDITIRYITDEESLIWTEDTTNSGPHSLWNNVRIDYDFEIRKIEIVIRDTANNKTVASNLMTISPDEKSTYQNNNIYLFRKFKNTEGCYAPDFNVNYDFVTDTLTDDDGNVFDDKNGKYGWLRVPPEIETDELLVACSAPVTSLTSKGSTVRWGDILAVSGTVNTIQDVHSSEIKVNVSPSAITISTNSQGVVGHDQAFAVKVTVESGSNAFKVLPNFNELTLDNGFTIHTGEESGDYILNLIITVPCNTFIGKGDASFDIPIQYIKQVPDGEYVYDYRNVANQPKFSDEVDENGNPIQTDDVVTISYTRSTGGVYLGAFNNIGAISGAGFNEDDYFTWEGSELTVSMSGYEFTLKPTTVYFYNCAGQWQQDHRSNHLAGALRDVLKTANDKFKDLDSALKLKENNPDASQYLEVLVANKVFTDELVANSAFIKNLVAEHAFVEALAAQEITVGAKDETGVYTGGSIQSLDFERGVKGWRINGYTDNDEASAEFNNVSIRGAVYATYLQLYDTNEKKFRTPSINDLANSDDIIDARVNNKTITSEQTLYFYQDESERISIDELKYPVFQPDETTEISDKATTSKWTTVKFDTINQSAPIINAFTCIKRKYKDDSIDFTNYIDESYLVSSAKEYDKVKNKNTVSYKIYILSSFDSADKITKPSKYSDVAIKQPVYGNTWAEIIPLWQRAQSGQSAESFKYYYSCEVSASSYLGTTYDFGKIQREYGLEDTYKAGDKATDADQHTVTNVYKIYTWTGLGDVTPEPPSKESEIKTYSTDYAKGVWKNTPVANETDRRYWFCNVTVYKNNDISCSLVRPDEEIAKLYNIQDGSTNAVTKQQKVYYKKRVAKGAKVEPPDRPTSWINAQGQDYNEWVWTKITNCTEADDYTDYLFSCTQYQTSKEITSCTTVGLDTDSCFDLENGYLRTNLIDVNTLLAQNIEITNGGYIQSKGFSSGTSGFKIDFNGSAILRNATVSGAITASSLKLSQQCVVGNNLTLGLDGKITANSATLTNANVSGSFNASDINPASNKGYIYYAGIQTFTQLGVINLRPDNTNYLILMKYFSNAGGQMGVDKVVTNIGMIRYEYTVPQSSATVISGWISTIIRRYDSSNGYYFEIMATGSRGYNETIMKIKGDDTIISAIGLGYGWNWKLDIAYLH